MGRFFTVTFTLPFKIQEINANVIHVLVYSWEFTGVDLGPRLSEQPQITFKILDII